MILISLHAENFRKYTHLQIDNLPERGLIGIIGGNESGKTSIGEALQFGLFGCTDRLLGDEANKLIHWGKERATVTLRFQHRGHEYRIVRSVDSAGNQAATLFSTEEEITLADTPEGVEQQIKALLGYSYGAFNKAFYWGQQKGNNSPNDSNNLLDIAGLKEYAGISARLEREQSTHQTNIETLANRRQQTIANLQSFHLDEGQLPRLQNIAKDVEENRQKIAQLATQLDKAAQPYPANHQRFQIANRRSRKIGWWTAFMLGIFVLALLVGAFLLLNPSWGQAITAALEPALRETLGRGAIRLASLAALISAALLVYGWYIDIRHLRPLRQQAENLDKAMQQSYQACTEPVSRLLASDSVDYLAARQVDFPADSYTHADMSAVPKWREDAKRYAAKALHVHIATDALKTALQNRQQELTGHLQLLEHDMATQRQQIEQVERLQALQQQQEAELAQAQHARAVGSTALGLLQRDASHTIERFNQLVKARCPEFLQRFTQGHYRTLEVLPDFSLKILSEEKGDFLDFSETSTGTQRQVALAMRVALANALADATKSEQQLLFLDEPFAFFDPERTDTTLHSLQENTTGRVCQIWLTTQTVPSGITLAKAIHCQQGNPVLQA